MRSRAAVLAVALTLALPASATAAEVELSGGELDYFGLGEENSLTISEITPGVYAVVDVPSVVIVPDVGCSNAGNDNTATCTGPLTHLFVNTGGGDDVIDVSSSTLTALTDPSSLMGGPGNDVIQGSIADDVMFGEAGDDLFEPGPGTDSMFGDDGRDTTSYESETDPISVDRSPGTSNDGPAGENDDANADGEVEVLVGGSAADDLTGSSDPDTIDGGAGADDIHGLGGPDSLSGGDGPDLIDGGAGPDRVNGDGGAATSFASDTLTGGTETDVVTYADRSDPVAVDLADPTGDGVAGELDSLAEFEYVEGGAGDDVLFGNGGANELMGGPGNDMLGGGLGDDSLLGGTGSDTVTYSARDVPVTADLGAGTPGGAAGESDTYMAVENLTGGTAADVLTGDGAPNAITGGAGADTIDGRGGADELRGGTEADTLRGGGGGDSIYGDAGQDNADGGDGDDSLRMRDEEADTVACADGLDSAIVDPIDALTGCDTADTGVPPAPVQQVVEVQVPVPVPVPAAPPAPSPVDVTRPKITLGSLSSTAKLASFLKGLKVSVGCDEPCSFTVELRGSAKSVSLARSYDLKLVSKSLTRRSGTRSLTLKPSKSLIGRAKKLTVQLHITAIDAAGNQSTKTKLIKVK